MEKTIKSIVSIVAISLVAFLPSISLSPVVLAADTGFNSPSAQAADTGGDNNGFEISPENAFSDGGGYARNIDGAGDRHRFYNYNFSLPSNAVINGIEVRLDWWLDSNSGSNSMDVQLSWNGGASWTFPPRTNNEEGTSDTDNKTLGGPTDTWGRTWDVSDFDNSNFRLRVTSNSSKNYRDFYLDWVAVKVYYTELIQPAPNPELEQSCGLDIALVIDSSGSINNTELGQMKDAFETFVDAFLPETPTQFSVTDFDDTATVLQGFTSDTPLINTAINTPTSGGYTNWEQGLLVAQGTFDPRLNPNLVIFASDGNPNRIGSPAPAQQVSESEAVEAAMVVANDLKNSGTRIIALGIGDDLDVANLEKISSADAVYTSNFETLAEDLAELASQLCGGTITARKIIDEDGNLQTPEDQTPGQGWSFDVAGSQEVTDQSGYTSAVQVDEGTYSVSETLQENYNLLDAYCDGSNGTGTLSGTTISGIEVGIQDIVSCVFYNSPQCIPSDEVCDGIDNDCDGYIDEDLTQPTANQNGLCAGNIEICSAGQWVPDENNYIPTDESCDNQDNNCDGNIDENLTQPAGNQNGLCYGNTETCYAGEWIPDGGNYEPTDEVCDAGQLDENCNGSSNEGCECIDGDTQQCGQTDVGLCEYGTQTCSGGLWGCCEGAVYPTTEICGNELDEDCDGSDLPCPLVTINAYKVVCQTEADLPNWGNRDVVTQITETTASDYVAQNQNCQLEAGWDFEWAYTATANPGDNIIGPAGTGWTTFGPTDSNGLTSTDIYSLSGNRIWVREVMKEGYIPFSGDTTWPRDNVSAELYCHNDVLNYDNYDYILNPQWNNAYYCVGFNAPVSTECTPQATTTCSTDLPGICSAGTQTCDETGSWGDCVQTNQATEEICGNELDDDCDGYVDGEDTDCQQCTPQDTQPCETGQLGVCSAGIQTCDELGSWGECLPTNEPTAENCENELDDDCDGYIDSEDTDCQLPPEPYCGDEVCNGNETCSTCPGDCGSCPIIIGGGSLGGDILLIIFNEENSGAQSVTAVVTWSTNKPATSRVVYDTVPHPTLGPLPNYGYAFSTGEDSNKVTSHEVIITGLTPGVTYYWRAISHGSPEVLGDELSFTTAAPQEIVLGEEEEEEEEVLAPVLGEEEEEELPAATTEETGGGEGVVTEVEEGGGVGLTSLLAAIGTFFGSANFCWLFFLLTVILTVLSLLRVIRKKAEKKNQWILPLITLILVILYCISPCGNCWVLIIIVSVLIILSYLFRKELGGQAPQTPMQ